MDERFRPTADLRPVVERCGAASLDRPFVHLAAFSEGEVERAGLACHSGVGAHGRRAKSIKYWVPKAQDTAPVDRDLGGS